MEYNRFFFISIKYSFYPFLLPLIFTSISIDFKKYILWLNLIISSEKPKTINININIFNFIFFLSCLAWQHNSKQLDLLGVCPCWLFVEVVWQNSRIADHHVDAKCGQRRDYNWERASVHLQTATSSSSSFSFPVAWGKSNNNAEARLPTWPPRRAH